MLEILGIVAVAIGLAVLAILVMAALKPNTFRIERSIAIDAPADRVFALINNLEAMNDWSPFTKTDPTIKIDYSGPDSGKGAAYVWDSTGRAGKGRMEVIGATPSSSVDMRLVMQKPFACDNLVRFSLQPAGGATTVTWAMSGPWPYLHRIMGTVFNTDKMVGGTFEKGLTALKAKVENS